MINVLDHGYVRLIESWGSDERVIEAARMSTDKGFEGWEGKRCKDCDDAGHLDVKGLYISYGHCQEATRTCKCKGTGTTGGDARLLAFLYKNRHMTPFEMGGMIIDVMAPIFVFREWQRHRTQSYNEMSARYIPLPDVNYIPSVDRIMNGIATAGTNKQARGHADGSELTDRDLNIWLANLSDVYERAQAVYEKGLLLGIPKEIARLPVPVGRYSRMRASVNLRNWLQFLELRQAQNAQWEIRQYANAVGELIAMQFPRTYALFKERT